MKLKNNYSNNTVRFGGKMQACICLFYTTFEYVGLYTLGYCICCHTFVFAWFLFFYRRVSWH